jgi:hypothetical protein
MTTALPEYDARAEGKAKKGGRRKWNAMMLVHAYRYAKAGLPDCDIAVALKVTISVFCRWKTLHPELGEALKLARKDDSGSSLADYCYRRLSPELKALWDRIRFWEKCEGGVAKIEAMLQDHGIHVRQQLYLHALVVGSFNHSRAMTRVGVNKRTFDAWVSSDPDFAQLVQEVEWHRVNFYEESLVGLVKANNTAAIIFANKNLSGSKYGQRTKVDVNVSGQVVHGMIDLTQLMEFIPEDVQLVLLEAIRKHSEKQQQARLNVNLTSPGQSLPELTAYERVAAQVADLPK